MKSMFERDGTREKKTRAQTRKCAIHTNFICKTNVEQEVCQIWWMTVHGLCESVVQCSHHISWA